MKSLKIPFQKFNSKITNMFIIKTTAFLIIFFATTSVFGQLYRFKTTSVAVSEKTDKGKWEKWSKAKDVNLVVTLDAQKNRIIVYSEILQLFEILQYSDEVETKNDDTVSFICKNNDGEECTISIITRKNQSNRKQLYIIYDDRILNYNIVNLKQ